MKGWHCLASNRQSHGAASLAGVALLCIAATMALGFTDPVENPHPPVFTPQSVTPAIDSLPTVNPPTGNAGSVVQLEGPVEQDEGFYVFGDDVIGDDAIGDKEKKGQTESIARSDNDAVDLALPIRRKIQLPPTRPFSFAEDSSLQNILGGINSRQWTDPSIYSPDRAIAELASRQVGVFYGVGFPDLRTYRQQKRRYNPLNPQPWSKMITWRELDGDENRAEPIARVRCMGLSPQAVARRADRYNEYILAYALEYKISVSLVKAVITEESCFNNDALSPMGAQGLMQLMPDTASWLNVSDPHNPQDNLRAGIGYLASLQEQFDTLELALAAYNAGPGNVRRYGGVPPFRETRAYVKKVKFNYRRYAAVTRFASR